MQSPEDIQNAARKLVEIYNEDLDQCLGSELIQFADFAQMFKDEEGDDIGREQFMYRLIKNKRIKGSFSNVEIALCMYLVMMVTNCSAERSFSEMKIIKNRLRTSMTHERLNNLAVMSVEHDILREVDSDELIEDFASCKARKVPTR